MAAPNILLFLSDDHARWALPHYGNRDVATPHLDALARRGGVFENAFCPTPVCSPARASLFTGLRASQHGLHDYLQSRPEYDDRDWLAGNRTLNEELGQAGYEVAYIGKWHIGRDWRRPAGVDHAFTLNGEYPIRHDGDNGFSRNGVIERREGNLTDIITEEARAWLRRRDRGRPFLLTVGYYATHSPWAHQPERLVQRYARAALPAPGGGEAAGRLNLELADASPAGRQAALANYYAAVSHIDEGVGAVLAELADSGGGPHDTLVVYTSDHGLCMGQHGVWGKGNATRPQNLLDDSLRIPMILAGAGLLPDGSRPGRFFDHLDLHATLRAVAGLAPPDPARGLVGRPLDAGNWHEAGRSIQFAEYGTARMARTARLKLIAWTTGAPPTLHAVGPGADEARDIAGLPEFRRDRDALLAALETHFNALARPAGTGPAALARNRFNANQAWDQPVPAAAAVSRTG